MWGVGGSLSSTREGRVARKTVRSVCKPKCSPSPWGAETGRRGSVRYSAHPEPAYLVRRYALGRDITLTALASFKGKGV